MYVCVYRPPKGTSKHSSTLSDEEDEDDPELIEAKIVLRDVNTSGKWKLLIIL